MSICRRLFFWEEPRSSFAWRSPKLAGVTHGSTFLLFSLCIPFGNIIGALSRQYQDALGEVQTYSTESLGAMRTVQSFAAEDRERHRYANKIGEPDLIPMWWPVNHKEHKTTYSVGFFKSIWNSGRSGKSSFDVSGLGIYFIRNGRFHLIVRYFVRFSVKRWLVQRARFSRPLAVEKIN